MKKFIILLLCLAICGCNLSQPVKKRKRLAVHQYTERVHTDNSIDAFVFWYIIMQPNGGCYYYSSTIQITDYSTINWSQSATVPTEITNASPSDITEQIQEVPIDQMSDDMEQQINENAANFSGLNEEEMGDYEGVSDGNEESSGESSSESGSDGSSSDCGGDGGGGGE